MPASTNHWDVALSKADMLLIRWGYVVPIVLYFLCIAFIAIPMALIYLIGELPYVREIQIAGLVISIALMIGSIIAPFVRLVHNSFDTRAMVADIKETVSRDSVKILPHSDTRQIVSFVEAHDAPSVFLGFWDVDLIPNLIKALAAKSQGKLYINPRVLKTVMLSLDTTPMRQNFYVTDCPRDSCTAFGYTDTGERSCIIFRGDPQDNAWWSVRLDPTSDYTNHLYQTYRHIYDQSSTPLESNLKALVLQTIYNDRRHENTEIIDSNTLAMFSWRTLHRYATVALKEAKHSIYAVDFTPPCLWATATGIMCDYRESHPLTIPKAKKIRVHGFTQTELAKNVSNYLKLIEYHRAMQVELFFMEKTEVGRRDIDQGFIVIDEEVVFCSRDVQSLGDQVTIEDFLFNTDSGTVILDIGKVGNWKRKFDVLLKEKGRLIASEAFESSLKEIISSAASKA